MASIWDPAFALKLSSFSFSTISCYDGPDFTGAHSASRMCFCNGLLNPLVCLCDSYPSAHPHHSDDSCSSHHCMPIWWHTPEPEDIHLHDNPIKSVLLAPFCRKRIWLCLKSYGKEIVKQFQSNFVFSENPGSGVETQRMYFACIYSLVCKVIGLLKKKSKTTTKKLWV